MRKVSNYLENLFAQEQDVETFVKVAAGVIIQEDENFTKRVLLIQRSPTDHWKLHWEVPRGKCDKGTGSKDENLIDCLKREVKEEVGLDIRPIKLIDFFDYIADHGKRKSRQFNFLCKMVDPEQKVRLSKEHSDFQWVMSLGEIELFVNSEIKKTISKVLNQNEKIVDYPDNPLSQEKIEEKLGSCLGKLLKQWEQRK